jgi:hypothetical protein
VILVDASVLLYAHSATSPHHEKASHWIESALARHEDIGLAWVTITAFLRLATNPAAYEQPLSMKEAVAIIDGYLSRSNVYAVSPGAEHWALFTRTCDQAQITSRLITDAHLATLALELGAALCSSDRDFTRFPGLRIINPLAQG